MLEATSTIGRSVDDGDDALVLLATWRGRVAGVALLLLASASASAWITWWVLHLGAGPVPLAIATLDTVGLLAGIGVAIGLVRSRHAVDRHADDDEFRYLDVIAAGHGVRHARHIRRQLRLAVRDATSGRPARSRDAALWGALADGPRRIGQVGGLGIALLLGMSAPLPPAWAVGALVAGLVSMSWSHRCLSGGVIRPGDRMRWAFASMGEVFAGGGDENDLAPRRWVGVVGAAVMLCLAIALRGISDRWTHGLAPMERNDRVVLLTGALVLVAGALVTLKQMGEPELRNSHLVARRLEERTARQLVLGGAVVLGVLGFLAGVLPGHVDAADDDVPGVERITDRDAIGGVRHGG